MKLSWSEITLEPNFQPSVLLYRLRNLLQQYLYVKHTANVVSDVDETTRKRNLLVFFADLGLGYKDFLIHVNATARK